LSSGTFLMNGSGFLFHMPRQLPQQKPISTPL
jgi:hypothetical protein